MMNKKDANKILNRLNKIRRLVDETSEIIEASYVVKKERTKSTARPAMLHGTKSFQDAWTQLQEALADSQEPEVLLEEFFRNKTKKEIKNLAQANALPIDTKATKKDQINQLIQLLKVNRAIKGL